MEKCLLRRFIRIMAEDTMNKVVLDLPSLSIFPSYIEALEEGHRMGIGKAASEEEILEKKENPKNTIQNFNKDKKGDTFESPDGSIFDCVPYEHLWLSKDDVFIGEVSFRHELNEFLTGFGGHAGYGIRPSYENQGYGTLALKLLRERAYSMGIERLLITCSPDNPASEKIIVNNGGEFIDISDNTFGFDRITKRYWVPVK